MLACLIYNSIAWRSGLLADHRCGAYMKNLFEAARVQEVKERIGFRWRPDSGQGLWGED